MKNSTVSVCIMTYNHERHIEQCIRSVVAQDTDARLEVLVGVDRGDDSTLDMVRKMSALFPEVVRCLERGKNVGGYRNYQLTLEQASGNYIAYLDGDDFWLPGKLQAQLDFLAAHTDCPAVYANAVVIDTAGNRVGIFTDPKPERISLDYLIERGNFLHHGSVLYRAAFAPLILDLGRPFIDYLVHILLATRGQLGFINEPLSAYRYNAPQSVRRRDNEGVRRRYWDAIAAQGETPAASRSVRRGKAEFLRQVFFRSLREGSPKLFLRWWKTVAATEADNKAPLAGYWVLAVLKRSVIESRALLRDKGWLKGERVFYQR